MNMTRKVSIKYELLGQHNGHKGYLQSIGGRIDMNSDAQIKKSAKITIKEDDLSNIDFYKDRIRPIYNLDGKDYPMGVFLISSPERVKKHNSVYRDIDCYDITQILLEDKVTSAYYIKEGVRHTSTVQSLIESAGILNHNIVDSDAQINRGREFEIGTSKLEIINTLLKEINYAELRTDHNGLIIAKPFIFPEGRDIDFIYSTDENIILNSSREKINSFDIPNVFLGVVSNPDVDPMRSVLINDDPTDPLSTVSRGRKIVKKYEYTDIYNKEHLDLLLKRTMEEERAGHKEYRFSSPINPNHNVENTLYIQDKVLEIDDKFVEKSWTIDLKIGGQMNHVCERVNTVGI